MKINIIFLPKKKKRNLLWQFIVNLLILKKVIIIRPDLLVHSIKPFSFFLLLLPILRINYGILVEGLAFSTLKSLPFKILHKYAKIIYPYSFKSSNFIISSYPDAYDWIERILEKKQSELKRNLKPQHQMIWCGVNCKFKNFLPSKQKINKITICYVGSFNSRHELDLLVNLIKKYSVLEAILIGDGNEYKRTYNLVKSNSLEKRIIFKGVLPSKDWLPLVCQSDFTWGVTNKDFHGVPIKVFESIYLGKISIVSKIKAFDELIKKKWVFVLENENKNNLEINITELIKIKPSSTSRCNA